MDNNTAYWLISSLIQSMAAIWAIIFGLVLGLHEFLERRLQELRKEEQKISNIITHQLKYRISTSNKILLLLMNVTLFLSLVSGILALVLFRSDFLIYSQIVFSVVSIFLLVIIISLWILHI
jgi:sterol desaturase/sphingolipid hydroxylase (fatty acid hydroxylase superfamily)